jgi:hypothetical protein
VFHQDPVLNELDDVAHAASLRFGNDGNWFLSFRLATYAVLARQRGADTSHRLLTQWLPGLPLTDHEQELAVCCFCMDSAIECWVFALNALGYGVLPASFLDIRDEGALRRISIENVIGKRPIEGWTELYPSVSQLWKAGEDRLRLIMNNHDVSKHRHSNFWGGTLRNDPPEELLQSFGLSSAAQLPFHSTPMKSILVPKEPKLALENHPKDLAQWRDLSDVKTEFDDLMVKTAACALEDARASIKHRLDGAP